jgi:N-acyl-D-aspartate/D-glutamate deacylase
MGFADSGAHLRNMAFYNAGLRFLDRVRRAEEAGAPIMTVERAVHRLTGELGEWYGLDAGTLEVGGRADVAVIDPEGLPESDDSYAEALMPEMGGIARMVNRNDGAVAATVVGGQVVYRQGTFTDGFGTTLRAGQFLPAAHVRRSTERAGAR